MLLNLLTSSVIVITLNALFMSNPVSIIIVIVLQTIILSIMMTTIYSTPWFSYILILVFLGGMLVLFSYITSLNQNSPFKPKNSLIFLSLVLLSVMMIQQKNMANTKMLPPQNTMNKLFFQDMEVTVLLASLLLMILLVVVQITSNFKGPLQTKT